MNRLGYQIQGPRKQIKSGRVEKKTGQDKQALGSLFRHFQAIIFILEPKKINHSEKVVGPSPTASLRYLMVHILTCNFEIEHEFFM